MSNFIPQIGMKGVYTLMAPFENALVSQTHYTCVAVRRLSDISSAGEDAYETYYSPFSIDENKYLSDIDDGACIVSLQSTSGAIVYVPSSYIQGFPEVNGYIYNSVVLAVMLGAVPDILDLTYIKSKLADVVLENLGVSSEVKTVVVSDPRIIMNDDHAAIEAARQARISNNTTDYQKYLEAIAQRDSAYAKIQILETQILEWHLAGKI